MKNPIHRIILVLIMSLVSALPCALAAPKLSHRVTGVVSRIDPASKTLWLEPGKPDTPTEFRLEDGRTHYKRDGMPAAAEDLRAGQTVELYFKQEGGQNVVVEISWQAGGSKTGNAGGA